MSVFSIDLILAEHIPAIFDVINQGTDQHIGQLTSEVNQLLGSWQSPNKASFEQDWDRYRQALLTIADVGPRLAHGLRQEIIYVQDAENVGF